MKKLILLFLSLLFLSGCDKAEPTRFEIDTINYYWRIDYEDRGQLIVYNVKNNEIKYNIHFDSYKIVYDDNVSSTKAILYRYSSGEYLLVVGV